MKVEELPDSTQRELGAINIMAAWFGGYFMRQAQRVVDKAINDNRR